MFELPDVKLSYLNEDSFTVIIQMRNNKSSTGCTTNKRAAD